MKTTAWVLFTCLLVLLLSEDKAEAFTQSDLTGTWLVHSLASGPGAPWWQRGSVAIGPDGSFTASVIDSDGTTNQPTGILNISSEGIVTSPGAATLEGGMDLNKTVMVWSDTWASGSPGTSEIKVLLKRAASYSLSDLTGTWLVHSLASGPGAPWWQRGSVAIGPDGSFTASVIDSDGTTNQPTGMLNISSEGIVTSPGAATLEGGMDLNKTVMVWSDTWSSGSPGTTAITVLVKTSDILDVDSDGIADSMDNCKIIPNPLQRDTDGDNYGNYCDPDFDNNGIVDISDLFYMKSNFLSTDPDADLNGDGVVNVSDLFILKSMFFGPPGPSGLVP